MPQPADRLSNLPPYIFASIASTIHSLQSKGHDILRLDIGNPDMPPPDAVIQTLAQAAKDSSKHGYSGYTGIPEFRKAIANYYRNRFGVSLQPNDNVLPLIGSKEGIVNLTTAYLNPDDIVLIPEIGYPAYAMATRLALAEIFWVPMLPAQNYMLDLSKIPAEIAARAKMLWINYPNNPTGGVITLQNYADIVEFCKEHDILLASDNPYVEITYDGWQANSVLEIEGAKEVAVEFMSFSKTFNMAGWRLGAAVGNEEALQNLLHVKSNMDSGHFKAIYEAGITALEQTNMEWIVHRNDIYEKRRDLLLDSLSSVGLTVPHIPRGAMYLWARPLPNANITAKDYVHEALHDAHVSLAPGNAYGPGGTGFIRLSVGVPESVIQTSLDRLSNWYRNKG